MPKTPYEIPDFVKEAGVDQKAYKRWLDHKASAHVKRDRKRWPEIEITVQDYRKAIHEAVKPSGGIDVYTKEHLAWNLISKYTNAESSTQGTVYRQKFALLPTVDHDQWSYRRSHQS